MILLFYTDRLQSELLTPQGAIRWITDHDLWVNTDQVKYGTYLEDNTSACKNILFSLRIKEVPQHYRITYSVDCIRGREVIKTERRTVSCGIDQGLVKLIGFAKTAECNAGDLKQGDRLYPSKILREYIDYTPEDFTGVILRVELVELINEPLTILDTRSKTGHYDWADVVFCE